MIFDTIENAKLYSGIYSGVDKILKKVLEVNTENYPKETLKVDGDKLFMIFADYETHSKSEAKAEAHKKYIDVMYMVEGEEAIYVKPTKDLKNITMPFDKDQDALLADVDDDATRVVLKAGSFIVLFPQDAHAPSCDVTAKSNVKKIIGKVMIA